MKINLFVFLFVQTSIALAQSDTLKKVTFSAYGELYYSYDFANPYNHEKPNFIYNHKRHNEVNANLIVAKANYLDENSRANLGLMVGNYAEYNLSAEPTWAQFIYEANIGVKLSKRHNIWLDAGIMPSHIGFESAVSADCWTLTRSILADNSPYYQTGLKFSFTNTSDKLNLAVLVLNGWQQIKKTDGQQNPSFGLQVNYKSSESLTLNYSNFIGTVNPNYLKSIRTFHNFYAQLFPQNKMACIAGFDIGTDKYNPFDYGVWFSPVLIVRYKLNEKIKMALRGEYYYDKNQIIVSTATSNGFQVSGISTNLDYNITKNIQFRIEGKIYNSKDKIFQDKSNANYALTTNMTIKL